MVKQTNLGYFTSTMQQLKEKAQTDVIPVDVNGKKQYIGILSIGNSSIRAKILIEVKDSFEKMFHNLEKKALQMITKQHLDPDWIKLDCVNQTEQISFKELEYELNHTRKNYFRYGISFDPDFNLAFLEQELNGNALIRTLSDGTIGLHENNINHYLSVKGSNRILFLKKTYENKAVLLFRTKSYFKDRSEEKIHYLYDGTLTNGLRKVTNMKKEVRTLITHSTEFLTRQVQQSGKFTYGYFSAFGKTIANYNILRHSSSLYAMMEGYEITKDQETLKAVERGIQYVIDTALVYKKEGDEGVAFIVEHANKGEVKLGSNATAILAMAKYMEVTGEDTYVKVAQDLARGILAMRLPDNSFIHVLQYPGFSIKELNRIIYYEGEAIFALLRLYALDKEPRWLEESKVSFDYFIDNDYWKHHDHWLSYAANELTQYDPDDKYFLFGMKNCQGRLKFIYQRETTFPTFLELTMAAYKMVQRMKELGKTELLSHIDETYLLETIDRRAEFQRVGFFYPEQAMYMKNPGLILHGFFIRHHSFRVRIDDVEHYLSGYCQYYHERLNKSSDFLPKELDV